jgi:hypothetical protein
VMGDLNISGWREARSRIPRVAYISTSPISMYLYVRTSTIAANAFNSVEDRGVVLATVEEAGHCLLRILSKQTVNGRILPGKKWSDSGYLDLDIDEYHDDLCRDIQKDQLLRTPPEDGLFLKGRW